MKFKKKIKNKIVKKVMQVLYLLLKPFIPYIMIFLMIFFFIILIVDAIYIQFSDEEGNMSMNEEELESYCEELEESEYEVYLDGEKTDGTINSEEKQQAITAEQIYSLMLFHNITDGSEMSKELAGQVSSNFKSKYYYKTSKIITETKKTDEQR